MSGHKNCKSHGKPNRGDIRRVLGENKKSLTEITEQLALPLTTVKYHVENLLDAGLAQIAHTKYSIKGGK